MPEQVVREGDCISSIAWKYGLLPAALWDHANNAGLKENRGNPNILHPGDVVHVPEREEKTESCATDQRHRFQKNGAPSRLRLRLLINGEPRANLTYTLEIDGELFSGNTDDDGMLSHPMAPDAKKGRLLVGENRDEYAFDLGYLDPIEEFTGVQERLINLGYDCGPADGILGRRTEQALQEFQQKYDLTESGEADEATRSRLVELHGS